MVVLALVSSASATLSWSYSGTTNPGDTITLSLTDTATNVTALQIDWITDNAAGGTAAPGSLNVKFVTAPNVGSSGSAYEMPAGDLVGVYGAYDPPNYATGILYTYYYTLPSIQQTVVISPVAGNTNSITYGTGSADVPSTSIVMTPEPMTIALLGLGGLFLRRKLS